MGTRHRPADVGFVRGRTLMAELAREARLARLDRGLSLADVGRAIGVSQPAMSRFERGTTADVGLVRVAQILSVVGLELSVRAYAGGQPLRDAGHARLLGRFRRGLHPSLGWATEVPLPIPGDRRAWDALVRGKGWRAGVEAETRPTDGQALVRRIELKRRDGAVDTVILLLPDTRHTRGFLAGAREFLSAAFPVPGLRAMHLLAAGDDPGGSSIVVL